MREHQIIINLKPEHYQELERLSRVSGARSVSIFVKERILASLGISNSAGAPSLSGGQNVASVTADIRRLHRDLQVFVAESLSGRDFGYVSEDVGAAIEAPGGSNAGNDDIDEDEDIEDPFTPGPPALTAGAGVSSQSGTAASTAASAATGAGASAQNKNVTRPPAAAAPVPDEVALGDGQALFDRAEIPVIPSNQAIPRPRQPEFSLRPRNPISGGIPFGGAPSLPLAVSSLPGAASPDPTTEPTEESSRQEPPKSTDPSLNNYGLRVAAPAPVQPPAEQSKVPTPAPTPPTIPTSRNIAPDPSVPDDLEELAERAFAISPRLGAMEEIDDDVPMFSDPLDELLGEIEDKEESAAQARSQGALSALSAADGSTQSSSGDENDDQSADDVEDSSEDDAAHGEAAEPDAHDDGQNADDGQSATAAQQEEDVVAPAANDNQTASAADESTAAQQSVGESSVQDEDKPPSSDSITGTTQNPPPISGGPPPRRRRT